MTDARVVWTPGALADLRRRVRRMGRDFHLQALAVEVERSSEDVNVALSALTGRTPEAAAEILAGQRSPMVWPTKARRLALQALREIHGL